MIVFTSSQGSAIRFRDSEFVEGFLEPKQVYHTPDGTRVEAGNYRRILLSNGQTLDVQETVEEIIQKLGWKETQLMTPSVSTQEQVSDDLPGAKIS